MVIASGWSEHVFCIFHKLSRLKYDFALGVTLRVGCL